MGVEFYWKYGENLNPTGHQSPAKSHEQCKASSLRNAFERHQKPRRMDCSVEGGYAETAGTLSGSAHGMETHFLLPASAVYLPRGLTRK